MTEQPKGLGVQWIVIILLVLAVFFGWLGYTDGSFFNVYASGIGIMLLGVAFTVWLVDYLSRQRESRLMAMLEAQARQQEEKQALRDEVVLKSQLTRELGSGDQGLGVRALRVLDEKGWLTDGSLAGAQLVGANLAGAALAWANLSNTFLSRANLEGADLSYANLSGASLSDTFMERVNLSQSNLAETDLRGADLSLSNLTEADMTGATLDEAQLSGATMVESNLHQAQASRTTFNGANMERANLVQADLTYSSFERADLSGANLGWANMSRTNLERTNLTEANLSGTNLEDAGLQGANLAGAFLFGARVSLKSLSTAKTLAGATMPDGLKYEDWVRRQAGEDVPDPVMRPELETPPSPLDYRATTEES